MMLRFISEPTEGKKFISIKPNNNNNNNNSTNSCKTLLNLNHESGYKIKINLNSQGRELTNSPWRTSEEIIGTIELSKNQLSSTTSTTPTPIISSLLVLCYWQSTTIISQHVIVPTSKSKVKVTKGPLEDTVVYEKERRIEYHRGYAIEGEGIELWEEASHLDNIRREVEGDFPLLGDRQPVLNSIASTSILPLPSIDTSVSNITSNDEIGSEIQSFPFKFLLPSITKSQFANPSLYPPVDRGDLMNTPRTPPPTYSSENYKDGGVEWIIEALLVFSDPTLSSPISPLSPINELLPLPPTFHPSSSSALYENLNALDSQGLLKSTPLLLVNRITFKFEPLDSDILPFYHSIKQPSIGRDPREELGGTPKVTTENFLSKEMIEGKGGKEKWDTYEKDYRVKSSLGRDIGIFRSEVSFPISLSISRYAPTLPLLFAFSYTPNISKSFLVGPTSTSTTSSPAKPIHLETLVVTLFERILTRSGSAIRSTMVLNELRKQSYNLGDLTPTATTTSNNTNRSNLRGGIELNESNTRDNCINLISSPSGTESDTGITSIRTQSNTKSNLLPSSKGLILLPSLPTQSPITTSLSLSFDLQSSTPLTPSSIIIPSSNPSSSSSSSFSNTTTTSTTTNPIQSKSKALKTCGTNFRLPNLEREYFFSITIELGKNNKKGIKVVIARVPLMILVGDDDIVPPWEEGREREEERSGIEMDRVGDGGTERVGGGGEDGLPGYI